MKQLILSATFFSIFFSSYSQTVIFHEDFDGIPGPTAGGAGTYTFPSGWRLRNVDNRTPDAQVSYINEAWERREDFGSSVVDSCMFSTSYYSPVGQADDWAWTPPITITSINNVLSWRARVYDGSYPDGYEVRIITQSSTPTGPTGGTGAIGNQITNSTVLFSTTAESSSWITRTVNLATYVGETVWIGFRNNSNDKFILVIDDVKVEEIFNYDARLTTINSQEYSQAPVSVNLSYPLSGTIKNDGVSPITDVTLTADVYNSANMIVHSTTSLPVNIAPTNSQVFNLSNFVPTTADTYTVHFYSSINETDQNNSNDTLITQIIVSDTVYARDNGIVIGSLGIGAGNGGYLGQQFSVNATDTLTSISMYVTKGYVGRKYAAVVWDMSAGIPNQIISYTDTLLYPDDSARFYTLPIQSLTLLNPGEYVVTAVEFAADSTIALGLSNNIFTPQKTWVNWPTNPGGWSNNEDFGSNYLKVYTLRANFGNLCHDVHYVQNITLCYGEELTVGNNTYNSDGIYHDTLPSGYCDSIITTNLIVLDEITHMVDTTICFGQTYTIGASEYTLTGTYTDTLSNGTCDSIVTTNLTVLDEITHMIDTTICFGQTYTIGASEYTLTGTYTDTLSNGTCDSIVTTNLIVLDEITHMVDTTICFGQTYTIGASEYTLTGTYTDTLSNGTCDSIVTTNLTMLPQMNVQVSLSNDQTTFICQPIVGSSYQWIDCNNGNQPISGATNNEYITSQIISVAVIVTSGDCNETSACLSNDELSVSDIHLTKFKLYPNPATSTIHLSAPQSGSFLLLNNLGQELQTIIVQAGTDTKIQVEKLARGIYFIKNTTTEEMIKVVLE